MGLHFKKLEHVVHIMVGLCAVDSTFGVKKLEFLIQSSQDYLMPNTKMLQGQRNIIQRQRDVTSMR